MAVLVVDDSVNRQGAHASSAAFASPATPPSILSRLKLETRGEHDAVERVLDLMDAALTRGGYCQRLQQFYGFYAPLEEALLARSNQGAGPAGDANLSAATRVALADRLNKTDHLRQDLHYLGVATAALPTCRQLPPLRHEAEVLGCLYVMEGATLGGRLITQHVKATLGITPETGGRFFEGYAGDTGKMWQSMRQLLLGSAPNAAVENAIVASAIATFACLRGWCEVTQPER